MDRAIFHHLQIKGKGYQVSGVDLSRKYQTLFEWTRYHKLYFISLYQSIPLANMLSNPWEIGGKDVLIYKRCLKNCIWSGNVLKFIMATKFQTLTDNSGDHLQNWSLLCLVILMFMWFYEWCLSLDLTSFEFSFSWK